MNADNAGRMAALADSRIPTKGAGRHLRVGGEREKTGMDVGSLYRAWSRSVQHSIRQRHEAVSGGFRQLHHLVSLLWWSTRPCFVGRGRARARPSPAQCK